MSLEVVQITLPGGGKAYTIRHIHPKTHAAEVLLRLKTAKSRLEDRSEPIPKDELHGHFFPGMGLDGASPLTSIDMYVELPFWLLARLRGHTLYPLSVLQRGRQAVEERSGRRRGSRALSCTMQARRII